MSDDIAIRVKNLSKCYQIYDSPQDRLKQSLIPRLQRAVGKSPTQYFREFWALKNVSFEVRRGEAVGVIGRNGSGKSTLLQIICGTLTPTAGSVETKGRIAALLELGSGFNPDFTGRENIYMNAALLGLNREEVDLRFDDIAAFADIGQFIEQPVKTYSSGMVVRLAFAVQSQIEPDVLVVDEALAVGDAKFQAKCFERLRQLRENGTSILLVTHSGEQIVTHCSSAILLHAGLQVEAGEPRKVVNTYMDLLFGKQRMSLEGADQNGMIENPLIVEGEPTELSNDKDIFSSRPGYNPHEYRWGDGMASFLDYYLAANGEPYPASVSSGQTILLVISIRFNRDLLRPILGITIKTKEGVTVYGVNSETLRCEDFHALGEKGSVMRVQADFRCTLAPGDYFMSLGIATRQGEEIIPHDRRYDVIHLQVRPNSTFFGITDLGLSLRARKVSS